VGLQAIRRDQLHAIDVAAGKLEVAIVTVRDQQRGLHQVQLAERESECLSLVRLERPGIDHSEFLVSELGRKRRAERAEDHFLRQIVRVAARLRSVDRAAMAPERRADRADTRPAGALLSPELAARAADFALVLRLVGACAKAVAIP